MEKWHTEEYAIVTLPWKNENESDQNQQQKTWLFRTQLLRKLLTEEIEYIMGCPAPVDTILKNWIEGG